MKQFIQFHVYWGESHYIAEAVDLPIVTQAKTLDELAHNIQEAVDVHLTGENPASFGLSPEPSVLINLELNSLVHA